MQPAAGLGAGADLQLWCSTRSVGQPQASPSVETLGSGPSHRQETGLSAQGIARDVSEWFFSALHGHQHYQRHVPVVSLILPIWK